MQELSKREYWADLYDAAQVVPIDKRSCVHRALRSYADVFLWDHLIPSALPAKPGLKVVELGSAPGANLVRFHQRYGCDVYGIEYTESGVAQNRALFAAHALDPAHVVHADIFDPELSTRYAGFFDVVFSFGLIEHFSDPQPAVERHMCLLKPGGTLILVIPNLRGIHHFLTVLFNRPLLALHNLPLMQRAAFQQLCSLSGTRSLYCGYYGVFTPDVHNTPPHSVKRHLLRCVKVACLPLQWLLRALRQYGRWESSMFSPYLVFLGRKPI